MRQTRNGLDRWQRWLPALLTAGLVAWTTGAPVNAIDATAEPAGGAVADKVTGRAAPATRGFPSVVILSAEGQAEAPVPSEPVVMDQVNKVFVPGVLLARAGQPVKFHNSDGILHNIHVLDLDTGETVFNVALPTSLVPYEHVFEVPGVYAVLCDVHPEMEAYIVVTRSPYAVVADANGRFELANVPAGRYTLRVWNLKEERQLERAVAIVTPETEIDLTGSP